MKSAANYQALAVFCFLVGLTALAGAESAGEKSPPPTELSPSDGGGRAEGGQEEARRLFIEGSKEGQLENWQRALELYQSSQSLYPHSTTLYNIAHCYGQLSDYASAWYFTTLALRPHSPDLKRQLSPENAASAEAQLKIFEGELGTLILELESEGRLFVDGRRPVPIGEGKAIALDQLEGADLPLPKSVVLIVNPGEHLLNFQDGTISKQLQVLASRGVTSPVALQIRTAAPKGKSKSIQEPNEAKVDPPSRARPHQTDRLPANDSTPKWLQRAQWVGFGVGTAGGVTALIAGIVASTTASALNQSCTPDGLCPSELEGMVQQHTRAVHWTNAGLWMAVSGGCVGLGATLLRVSLGKNNNVTAEGLPGGLRLQGTF